MLLELMDQLPKPVVIFPRALSIEPDGSVLLVWTAPGEVNENHLKADEVNLKTLAKLISRT